MWGTVEPCTRPHQGGYTQTHFEIHSDARIERNLRKRSIEEQRAARRKDLERRRTALANLLREDEMRNLQEFQAKTETPEQRLERTRQRALQLKATREEEDNKTAAEIMERKYADESDEIRTKRSQLEALHIAADQLFQINQKRIAKASEGERDRYFAQVWEEERLKGVEEDNRRKARARQLTAEMMTKLGEQMEEIRERKMKDADLKKEEAALLEENLRNRRILEQQELDELNRERREKFREYKRFNKLAEMKALREAKEKRDEEIAFIQSVLDKEKKEMEAEQAVRDLHRHERILERELLLDEMRQQKDDEKELDRLLAEEAEAEYRKKQAVWQKEQDARDKLLKEVIEDRQRMIAQKRQQKIDEIEENYLEAARILDAIERDTSEADKAAAAKQRNYEIAKFQMEQAREKRQAAEDEITKERNFETKDAQYNLARLAAEKKAMSEIDRSRGDMQKYVHDLQEDLEEQPLSQPKARQRQMQVDLNKETQQLAKERTFRATQGNTTTTRGMQHYQKTGFW
ncbi:putative flagellar associated protein [Blattamonas nauphoetae]|uniref:Cilia- and flagella-associated protein 53 n=1 Tax=Blattamonas nauphoetae TaxID=2049346 RepID=A0ABQ9Y4F0_9EUKA|nr:putative flagellar associated protein [Blattamonas nauphoetae]